MTGNLNRVIQSRLGDLHWVGNVLDPYQVFTTVCLTLRKFIPTSYSGNTTRKRRNRLGGLYWVREVFNLYLVCISVCPPLRKCTTTFHFRDTARSDFIKVRGNSTLDCVPQNTLGVLYRAGKVLNLYHIFIPVCPPHGGNLPQSLF